MSRLLSQYQQKLRALEQLQNELAQMESSKELEQERAFSDQLRALQHEYAISDKTLLVMLGLVTPASTAPAGAGPKQRTNRATTYRYTNPYTKETVIASRSSNKVVKAWIAQYGADVVSSWREVMESAA